MTQEIWKDILGYEDYYQISNLGNVRKKGRSVFKKEGGFLRYEKPKILKQNKWRY